MSTEIEDRVAAALRDRGDAAVDVTALRTGAVTRGRRLRWRRRLLTTGALAVVLVLAGGLAVRFGPAVGPARRPAGPPPVQALATALPSSDAPGAASRPDLVGDDLSVIHFDVDLAALRIVEASWGTGAGRELAELTQLIDGQLIINVRVSVSRTPPTGAQPGGDFSPEPTTSTQPGEVAGRPATIRALQAGFDGLTNWQVLWQPVDGLWAGIVMGAVDPRLVLAAATAVHFDRAQRCVVPFAVGTVPAGLRPTSCGTDFGASGKGAGGWLNSAIEYTCDADRTTLTLAVGNYTEDSAFVPNRTVAGRPAMWFRRPDGGHLQVLWVAADATHPPLFVYVDGDHEADAILLASGLTWAPDLQQPATWPLRPAGDR